MSSRAALLFSLVVFSLVVSSAVDSGVVVSKSSLADGKALAVISNAQTVSTAVSAGTTGH